MYSKRLKEDLYAHGIECWIIIDTIKDANLINKTKESGSGCVKVRHFKQKPARIKSMIVRGGTCPDCLLEHNVKIT